MGICYKCEAETEQNCLWCHQSACEKHLHEVQGAKICRKCFKTTPDYQEYKMKKVEEKMKKKHKKSLVK